MSKWKMNLSFSSIHPNSARDQLICLGSLATTLNQVLWNQMRLVETLLRITIHTVLPRSKAISLPHWLWTLLQPLARCTLSQLDFNFRFQSLCREVQSLIWKMNNWPFETILDKHNLTWSGSVQRSLRWPFLLTMEEEKWISKLKITLINLNLIYWKLILAKSKRTISELCMNVLMAWMVFSVKMVVMVRNTRNF